MSALETRVPPLVVVALTGLAMWVAATSVPALAIQIPGRRVVVAALAAAGAFLALAGVVQFRRARTTLDPTRPARTTALVTSGVYRYSRHPMYVGLFLMLAAWASYLSNVLAFIALPAFVAYVSRFQMVPEERMLRATFGAAYAEYEKSVRRWL